MPQYSPASKINHELSSYQPLSRQGPLGYLHLNARYHTVGKCNETPSQSQRSTVQATPSLQELERARLEYPRAVARIRLLFRSNLHQSRRRKTLDHRTGSS
ncbi:hypothetical protein PM082_018311 [Marasmius tenuissimus]|nr:hypothetical protein PM082_018311 [Marasmius tenuissimus]